ncbi:MAG: hypothetical protein NTW10_09345 [Bacteroidetes bacterium]|nr:hypothetical protein [Bacteroidota bacterium]
MGSRGRIIFCFIFLISNDSYSAGDPLIIGGRAAALGYTAVTRSDEWSAFNNQAGLAWCRRFSAGIYFENRFLLKEVSEKALAVTLPVNKGAFGVSFHHFGFSLYSEMNAGIAYGMRLTKNFSAGIQADYLRLHVADGFKDNTVFSCEIGLQFRAGEHLWLGLHMANPVPVKLSQGNGERIPAVIRFGLSWRITEGLSSEAEVEKNLVRKPSLKAGIEYRPAKPLFIRIGFLSNPATFTFGAGLELGNLHLDVASSYHMVLGYSPQVSISWLFGKK